MKDFENEIFERDTKNGNRECAILQSPGNAFFPPFCSLSNFFLQSEKLYVMGKTRERSTFKSDHGSRILVRSFGNVLIILSTKSHVLLI